MASYMLTIHMKRKTDFIMVYVTVHEAEDSARIRNKKKTTKLVAVDASVRSKLNNYLHS